MPIRLSRHATLVHFIAGDGTRLEGRLARGAPERAVVLCHPHPLHGGSMLTPVIMTVEQVFQEAGFTTLAFNFRGVGGSSGRHGGGTAEQDDIRAAFDWLQGQPDVDKERLGLAGYSFGGGVALPVACADGRVRAVALISPYFESPPAALLKECLKPKLIMGGGSDGMVPVSTVEQYGREAAEPKALELVKGADHFWGGYEGKMAERVAAFFQEYL